MGNIIRAQSMCKTYGSHDVFVDVSFDIPAGTICGFIGTSGSGKTTLLHSILGFCPLDEGSLQINIDDEYIEVYSSPRKLRKVLGFSSQVPSVYQQLTLRENLLYFASLYRVPAKHAHAKADELLRLVGLYDAQHQRVSTLSKGMEKRLDIACALMHSPKILVLDEPTADLDPILRKQMWKLLKDIRDKGMTIVLSSHFLDEIDMHCDYIGILHNKRLAHFCSPDELHNTFGIDKSIVVRFDPPEYNAVIQMLTKSKLVKLTAAHQNDSYLYLSASNLQSLLLVLSSYCKKRNIVIADIQSSSETLNAIFEALVTKGD